ncbi:sigma-70 family RNA polymerase sigma factor [Lentibacillus sp. CBA3610]|uniref:sigma-70 family RNA polymerase sigma factor n=1 Tax=Lentibacillus sp. CBA3610 TaxID=2518176 RepID=UPI0015962806|nr:sigma-70 family RNA polymerase sigma factor [Lentibacillus sp. CBA3610]QKY70281.1 sigma-70 family RNA polymerase sigma factor [Lentibacillus sp. CBA3610]
MHDKDRLSFEEIFQQNEQRIHYHMHKLGIHDGKGEYYVEGIYAMWMAYKKYDPNKGPLGTYFNYTIRYRLIDMLRKKTKEDHHQQLATQAVSEAADQGYLADSQRIDAPGETDADEAFWNRIRDRLTLNQWKWVQLYIIEDMTLKEIAQQEGVTVEAVKSWGRGVRKKLREDKEALAKLYK